jgi:hypothetical protein
MLMVRCMKMLQPAFLLALVALPDVADGVRQPHGGALQVRLKSLLLPRFRIAKKSIQFASICQCPKPSARQNGTVRFLGVRNN